MSEETIQKKALKTVVTLKILKVEESLLVEVNKEVVVARAALGRIDSRMRS